MPYHISQSRWYLKKAARRGLAATAWASGWLAARRRLTAGPQVRVLTYHRFGDSRRDPFCLPQETFDRQMRYLAQRRLAVSLDHVEALLAGGGKDLPDGAVLVTVDDGFRSVYTHMLPVLRHYGIPAVAYVTPGLVRRPGGCRDGSEEYLSWDELDHLAAGGVTIGSHGWTHRSLGRMGPVEARHEAARSRQTLERRLGRRVASFAYPFGTRADFNRMTGNVLAETGYTTGFTSQHGPITGRSDPLELPRVKVEGGEGLSMFRLICRGAIDGWRLVDRTLWQLQRGGT